MQYLRRSDGMRNRTLTSATPKPPGLDTAKLKGSLRAPPLTEPSEKMAPATANSAAAFAAVAIFWRATASRTERQFVAIPPEGDAAKKKRRSKADRRLGAPHEFQTRAVLELSATTG